MTQKYHKWPVILIITVLSHSILHAMQQGSPNSQSLLGALTSSVTSLYSSVTNANPHQDPEKMTLADRAYRGLKNWKQDPNLNDAKLSLTNWDKKDDPKDPVLIAEKNKTKKVYASIETFTKDPATAALPDSSTLQTYTNRCTGLVQATFQDNNYKDNQRMYARAKEILNNFPAAPWAVLVCAVNVGLKHEKDLIKCTDNNVPKKTDEKKIYPSLSINENAEDEKINKTLLQVISEKQKELEDLYKLLNSTTTVQRIAENTDKRKRSKSFS